MAPMSFQWPLVTSGISAIKTPSPGLVPGRVRTKPHGLRSIKSGTDTAVGSTKIRLFKAAWTLSIRLRSSHVLMSCSGRSKIVQGLAVSLVAIVVQAANYDGELAAVGV